jgi:hypothetical protein
VDVDRGRVVTVVGDLFAVVATVVCASTGADGDEEGADVVEGATAALGAGGLLPPRTLTRTTRTTRATSSNVSALRSARNGCRRRRGGGGLKAAGGAGQSGWLDWLVNAAPSCE